MLPNGEPGGGIPPILPDPGEVLTQVEKCLRSGDLTSEACLKVLDSLRPGQAACKQECTKPKYDGNPVCAIIEALPGGDGGLPDLPGPARPPGLPGSAGLLGRRSSGGAPDGATPSPAALYGGAS